MYFTLPQEYREATTEDLESRVEAARERLGERLVILCHHYQRLEVVRHYDYLGDSFYLAKMAAEQEKADLIVFCGVHFMAESADLLTRDHQRVFMPNPLAGCPMADMADIPDVLAAWDDLQDFGGAQRITPLSYMNSAALLKAFCGENGGLICTSSNAEAAMRWSWDKREKIFFFPDQHLGYNTARKMGIPDNEMVIWDFKQERGGLTDEQIEGAKVILWKGHCHVHMNFTSAQADYMRKKYPGIKILVHPECPWDVVESADAVGSTSFIVNYVAEQKPGSTIAIGTELNLINRMAHENPDKTILELSGQICPVCANMYRTTINDLAYCLENFEEIKPIRVSPKVRDYALLALNRMLDVSKPTPQPLQSI